MPISASPLLLSSFVLAHAAWNVSDLPKGDLLCPLAIVEQSGQRKLSRFEASSQAEAIAHGKEAISEASKTADAWAFAHDGLMRAKDGSKVDIISVDFWAKGMSRPAALIQKYEPLAEKGKFLLIGEPVLVIDGVAQTQDQAKEALQTIQQGIASHTKVAPLLWSGWRTE